MDGLLSISPLDLLAVAAGITGALLLYLSFADRRRGVTRRGIAMVDRLEGWRMLLTGITLTGVGVALFWDLRWLLVMSLGFGFVELHEATHVIRAWRWAEAGQRRERPAEPARPLHSP